MGRGIIGAMDKRARDRITDYEQQHTLEVGTVEGQSETGVDVQLSGSQRYLRNVPMLQGVETYKGAQVILTRVTRQKWVILGVVQRFGGEGDTTETSNILSGIANLTATTEWGFVRLQWDASYFDVRCYQVMVNTSQSESGATTYATDNSWLHYSNTAGTYYAKVRMVGPDWSYGSWSSWVTMTVEDIDHGALDGLGDDDHPQYTSLKTGWDGDIFTLCTLSVDDGSRTVTLAPTGADIEYWIAGTKYTTGTASVQFADTEGKWYIYFLADTLTASQTAWTMDETKAFVAELYWDATNSRTVQLASELHGWVFPDHLHEYLHETFGTRWESGLGVSDAGSGQINIAAGECHDEDIELIFTDDAGSGWWDQTLSPAECEILYRSGASGYWRRFAAASATPVPLTANVLQYNEWTGATWQLSDVTLNKYAAYWVLATNSTSNPIVIVPGQEDGDTLATAVDGNSLADMSFAGLGVDEHKVIARLIVQRQAGSPYYNIAQIDDYRNIADEPSSGGAVIGDHGSLIGLGDDDHTQYVLTDHSRDLAFTPTVLTDWDGDADPGDVDDALDQLAERVDDLEGAAGSGVEFAFWVAGAIGTASDFPEAWIGTTSGTIGNVYIRCGNSGTAGTTTVDINLNGTTIFTTQASRPQLAWDDVDGVAKSGTPDVTAISEYDVITFDIDEVATGAEDLTIVMRIT